MLVARCMQRARASRGSRGSSHRRPSPTPISSRSTWAERWGFGVSTDVGRLPQARAASDPNRIGLASLPLADRTAITATPCTGRARVDRVSAVSERRRLSACASVCCHRCDPRSPISMPGSPRIPARLGALDAWRACVASVAGGVVARPAAFAADALIERFDARPRARTTPASMAGWWRCRPTSGDVAAIVAGCEAAYASDARAGGRAASKRRFVGDHARRSAAIGAAIRAAEAALPTLPP